MIIMFVRAYQRGAIMTADLCVSKFSSTSTRNAKAPSLQYMTRSKGRRIAYHSTPGGSPGVIFCSGFMSNMGGMKALALEEYCQTKGHAFTRFDYLACGQSDGDPRDVTFSDWRDDMMAVLNELTTGPQIMVGSSMGGWLVLLAALAHPDRIHSLICVASAPDFKQRRVELLGPKTELNSEYGPYIITKRFLDDLDTHDILGRDTIPLTCPVRLIHGMGDLSVSYKNSLTIAEKLESNNVRVLLRKKGDHRLSEPEDIQILLEQLDNLIYGNKEVLYS